MNINDVIKWIEQSNGRIFSIIFRKRGTGDTREMTCRIGVKKYLNPEPTREGVDFKDKRLVPVYDMKVEGYRSIPIEGIMRIKINGEWHDVLHNGI